MQLSNIMHYYFLDHELGLGCHQEVTNETVRIAAGDPEDAICRGI